MSHQYSRKRQRGTTDMNCVYTKTGGVNMASLGGSPADLSLTEEHIWSPVQHQEIVPENMTNASFQIPTEAKATEMSNLHSFTTQCSNIMAGESENSTNFPKSPVDKERLHAIYIEHNIIPLLPESEVQQNDQFPLVRGIKSYYPKLSSPVKTPTHISEQAYTIPLNISTLPPPTSLPSPKITPGEIPNEIFASDVKHHITYPISCGTLKTRPDDAMQEYSQFVPLLKQITGHNCSEFLVQCLRDHHMHMSLDEFYTLLFDWTSSRAETSQTTHILSVPPNSSADLKLRERRFCELILNSFKDPGFVGKHFPNACLVSPLSNSVNLHEVLRSLLALKILFSSVLRVDDQSSSHMSVPRNSLYNAYYVLCNLLARSHPAISNCPGFTQSIILSQSQFGRLSHMVFPDLVEKRLGGRRTSKVHYVNITWNRKIIDDEILKMVILEKDELDKLFENNSSTSVKVTPRVIPTKRRYHQPTLPAPQKYPKPSHSFIDTSYRYPRSTCSPRVWTEEVGAVPQKSKWCEEKMEESLRKLETFGLELRPFVSNYNAAVISDDPKETFMEFLLSSMQVLSLTSGGLQVLNHFYLVVLLVLFPVSISSDQEVSSSHKEHFRKSVNALVAKLKSEKSMFTYIDEISLSIFTRLLRKMVTLSEMSSSKVKAHISEKVSKCMLRDFELAGNVNEGDVGKNSRLQEAYMNSIIFTMNAFIFKLDKDGSHPSSKDVIRMICQSAKSYKQVVCSSYEAFSKLPICQTSQDISTVPQDIPFQIFKIMAQMFHDVTLAEKTFSGFPIPVVSTIMSNMFKTTQEVSFQDFGNRDIEISKETFRCWWVVSSMVQEYICIISEIVALSESLSPRNTSLNVMYNG